MLSSRTKCNYLGLNIIIWDAMLSSGANVIIWDEMLMELLYYCYNLVFSCDVIIWVDNTPFFIFTGNFTHDVIIWVDNTPFLIFTGNFTHSFESENK